MTLRVEVLPARTLIGCDHPHHDSGTSALAGRRLAPTLGLEFIVVRSFAPRLPAELLHHDPFPDWFGGRVGQGVLPT